MDGGGSSAGAGAIFPRESGTVRVAVLPRRRDDVAKRNVRPVGVVIGRDMEHRLE